MSIKTIKVSLAIENPELAEQWHPTKNGELTPNDVTVGSNKKVWWRCEKGHEWDVAVCDRVRGRNCPYCSGKRVCEDNCLQIILPDLAMQWHPTKNDDLTPNDVTTGSNKKVWWKCEQGHEWYAVIHSRVKGNGCPYCAGRLACEDNCLQNINPNLASQWHPTENKELTPYEVTTKSNRIVWWKCEQGHEWKATIASRTSGNGCPYCAGKFACEDNCLQTLYPELAKQWHPTKNESLTPSDITIGSNKKVWWQCKKGHEWKATIYPRTKNVGCPHCSNESKTSFPEQAIYFYMKKIFADAENRYKYDGRWEVDIYIPCLNFGIEYDGIYFHGKDKCSDSLKEKYIFESGGYLLRVKETDEKINNCYINGNIIYCNHNPSEYQLSEAIQLCVNYVSDNIAKKPYNISIDVNRDRANINELYIFTEKENSLFALYPELVAQWHPEKNSSINPAMIRPKTNKKFWWVCEKGHEWDATVNSRASGNGCPFCTGRCACRDNSLQTLNPQLAKEWHPHNNDDLTPRDVTLNSNKEVWWQCEKGHEWKTSVTERTRGKGCPYCSGQRVCVDNCLQTILPDLAKQWHPTKNNGVTPNDVTPGSNKIAWWQCENGHEWEAKVNNRKNGKGCPYCSGRRASSDNSLQAKNPQLSKQWNFAKNGDFTPNDVSEGSDKIVWWLCDNGHEWEASIYNRAKKGRGCPYCRKSKTKNI